MIDEIEKLDEKRDALYYGGREKDFDHWINLYDVLSRSLCTAQVASTPTDMLEAAPT